VKEMLRRRSGEICLYKELSTTTVTTQKGRKQGRRRRLLEEDDWWCGVWARGRGALLYPRSRCHGWDGLASAWCLAQQSGAVHVSTETGRAHACAQ
jgi:hypothetical protein